MLVLTIIQYIIAVPSEPRSTCVFEDLGFVIAGASNGDIYKWYYVTNILTTYTGIHINRVKHKIYSRYLPLLVSTIQISSLQLVMIGVQKNWIHQIYR